MRSLDTLEERLLYIEIFVIHPILISLTFSGGDFVENLRKRASFSVNETKRPLPAPNSFPPARRCACYDRRRLPLPVRTRGGNVRLCDSLRQQRNHQLNALLKLASLPIAHMIIRAISNTEQAQVRASLAFAPFIPALPLPLPLPRPALRDRASASPVGATWCARPTRFRYISER